MKRGFAHRLLAAVLSAALIADAPAFAFASQPLPLKTAASPAVFTEQAIPAQIIFSIFNFARRSGSRPKKLVGIRARNVVAATAYITAAISTVVHSQGTTAPPHLISWSAVPVLMTFGLSLVALGFIAFHEWQRREVVRFDKNTNVYIQSLEKEPIPANYLSWSLAEVAAVKAATEIVRAGYRGKGAQTGLTKEEIQTAKDEADGLAFRTILQVFRDAWAGVLVYNSEGKGRDGVEQSFVGGDFTGVQGAGRLITRQMHRFGHTVFIVFLAVVASMDVIEGTTATVMNRPGLSGGSTVIVSGPGVKSLGQAPDIYADLIATSIPEHVDHFKRQPLDPDLDVISNLNRISEAIGRPFANMEVIILGRDRELTRLQRMLPNVPLETIKEAIKVSKKEPLGCFLEDPQTHLLVRVIPDGSFLPAIKAARGETLTPGRHLIYYGSSGSPEAMMDLATLSGYREEGAVVSLKLLSKNVNDVELKTGAYAFSEEELNGDPGKPAKPATLDRPAEKAVSPAPGLNQLRRDDVESIRNHTKLFTLWDVDGDVDAVITFITDNALWTTPGDTPQNLRGIRINGGEASTTLRIRTIKGKAKAWIKHRSNRLYGAPKHISITGFPGAGKGAQGPTLARELGIEPVSTGNLLRAAAQTDEFPEVRAVMKAGDLVKDELMLSMLLQELKKSKYAPGELADGFPRTLEQLKMVQEGRLDIDAFVVFVVSADDYRQRARIRNEEALAVDAAAHAVGSRIKTAREDDAPEAVESRIRNYDKTKAMVDEIRRVHPEKIIYINTASPKDIVFESTQQSIDYTYEHQILPAIQEWIADYRSNGNGRKPRNGGWFKTERMNVFAHPTLNKLGLEVKRFVSYFVGIGAVVSGLIVWFSNLSRTSMRPAVLSRFGGAA